MAAFNKFHTAVADAYNGKHNFGSNTLKIFLTNTAPAAANLVKSDIPEIAAGNGYSAGGVTIPITSSAQVSGLYSLVPTADQTITASGGTIGPFRYAVFYNDTHASKPLISWYDYGSAITLQIGEALLLDAQATLFTAQ